MFSSDSNRNNKILSKANKFLNEETSLKEQGIEIFGEGIIAVYLFKDTYSNQYYFCFQQTNEAENIEILEVAFTLADIQKLASAEELGSDEYKILQPIYDYISNKLDEQSIPWYFSGIMKIIHNANICIDDNVAASLQQLVIAFDTITNEINKDVHAYPIGAALRLLDQFARRLRHDGSIKNLTMDEISCKLQDILIVCAIVALKIDFDKAVFTNDFLSFSSEDENTLFKLEREHLNILKYSPDLPLAEEQKAQRITQLLSYIDKQDLLTFKNELKNCKDTDLVNFPLLLEGLLANCHIDTNQEVKPADESCKPHHQ